MSVDALTDAMFEDVERFGETYAVVVVVGDEIVCERYGGALPHFDAPPEPVTPQTRLLSWSMAKSILHAAVGILVGDGRLELDAPADVPRWRERDDDPRAAITLEHLLTMRDGLDFVEDYVDDRVSDTIQMLFGDGKDDVAAYAASRPLLHEPDTHFNYSSGTSNIVAAVAARAVGGGDAFVSFMHERLFAPIGMQSAEPRQDAAGTFIGSSYVYATARDFARFGRLYLHDGAWDGTRVLPEGWVAHGRRVRSVDPEDGPYGAHWWVVGDEWDSFRAAGYEGQSILVCPPLDTVVVRLGRSDVTQYPALGTWRADVLAAVSSPG